MKKLVQLKNKENENLDPINLNYEKRLQTLENDIYSTSEVDTGKKWIDDKSIYRKVIEVSSIIQPIEPETGYTISDANINAETIVNGYLLRGGTNSLVYKNILYVQAYIDSINNTQHIMVKTAGSETSINVNNVPLYLVIEYTKATD